MAEGGLLVAVSQSAIRHPHSPMLTMPRSAYTLFELMMVMVLIVAGAAITIPVAESLLSPNRLRASSDQVRAQWAEMRGRAMNQGRAYRFRVMVNTSKFLIEPDEGEENVGNPNDPVFNFEGELPEQVVFLKGDADLVGQTSVPAGGSAWETVVVYLPDGTAREDTSVFFGLPGLRAAGLQVRALTGAVRVLEPSTKTEGQP